MLDKTILVFYVDVEHMPHDEASGYLDAIREHTRLSEEDEAQIIKYVIPVREGGTRVECLNPSSAYCNDNKELVEKLAMVNDRLDRVDGIMFPVTRSVIVEKTK